MARYARVADGAIAEIILLPEGVAIEDAFHPDIAATMHPCDDSVAEGWTYDGARFAAPIIPPPSREQLLAHAAAKRWRVETGGITVAGVAVATDDRAKMMIIGARSAAIADADWTTDWIGADGAIHRLDAAAMIAISDAVQAHVGAAFSAYAAILAAIEAGTITSLAEIDAAAWPA